MRPLPLLAAALAGLAVLAAAVLLLHGDGPPASPAPPRVAAGAPAPPPLHLPVPPGDGEPEPQLAAMPERLAAAAAPAPDGVAPQDAGVVVRGRLVDEARQPVAGEVVELQLEVDPWDARGRRQQRTRLGRTHSDEDGRFVLPAHTGAEHVLLAGGLRHPRVVQERVAAGDELLVVLPPPGALAGVVADDESGQPLPGALVLVLGPGTQILAEAGEGGRFEVSPLPDAPLLVSAWTPGYAATVRENVLAGDEGLLLALAEGAPVSGVVVDGDGGEPLPGAEVHLTVSVPAALAAAADALVEERLVVEQVALAGDDGAFVLDDVPPRGFTLRVTAEGYVPALVERYRERAVEPGDELQLELHRPPLLAGFVVRDRDGAPARAAVRVEGPQGVIATGESDAAGHFELLLESWDGEGPLEIVAVDAGGAGARHKQQRRDGEEELLLRLVDPVALSVRVEAGGSPVDGAALAVLSEGSPPTLGASRAAADVRLVHPLAGPHVRHVEVQARHLGATSLPLVLDVEALSDGEPVLLDLQAGVHVTGAVHDEAGQPLPFGEVRFLLPERALSGRVDPAGRFELGPVEEGVEGVLRVDVEGYRTATQTVVTGTGDVDVFLQPHVYWEGRVVDAATGGEPSGWRGVLQTQVMHDGKPLWRDTGQRLQPAPGGDGAFRCLLPGAAPYRLTATAPGRLTASSVAVDFDGERAPAPSELLLFPSAVLHVQLLDASGRPVPGYALSLVDAERASAAGEPTGRMRRGGRALRTDDDGRVEVDLALGGSFRLAAGPKWLEPSHVTVTPGPPVERTWRIGPTGDLRVTLRDVNGAPLVDPLVSLRAAGRDAEHWVKRRVRARGPTEAVRFDALPPGTWRVQVRPRGGAAVERAVTVVASRLVHLDVTWDPAAARPKARSKGGGGGGGRAGR